MNAYNIQSQHGSRHFRFLEEISSLFCNNRDLVLAPLRPLERASFAVAG